jgi:carboxylesterase
MAIADRTIYLGWGVPLYSRFFALVTQRWCADLFWFSEREPFGIKDRRVRALVTAAIQSGDSSQAGQLSNPGGVMLELRWLVKTVCRELATIRQPSLILHPREDDRASLRNALYLQNRLAGRVEVFILDDSYHVITLDRQRQVAIDRTNQFAASISHQQLWPHGVPPVGTFEAKSCPL